MMNLNPGLKPSIAFSLILHIMAVSLLFFMPQGGIKKGKPLFARLVTPEQIIKNDAGRASVSKKDRMSKKSIPSSQKELQRAGKEESSKVGSLRESGHVKGHQGIQRDDKVLREDVPTPKDLKEADGPLRPETRTPPIQVPHLPKEGLFDRDVLERLAKNEKEEPVPDRGITFDTNELRYHSYMLRLKEKIEGIWRYPPEAAEKGIYGDLYIRFTIKKDGRLGNVELVRTSGYRNLDEAAMRALRDAEPFWPLPQEWKKDELVITGHFIYSLYGVYLR